MTLPLLDPRNYDWAESDPIRWRSFLREQLYEQRKGLSDLTGKPLWWDGFHVHESLFSRKWTPKIRWQWMLFSSVNCLLLRPEEHIPHPPSRVEAYWLSVILHGKVAVDSWVDSLPWKVRPSQPWSGTSGLAVITIIRHTHKISRGSIWSERATQCPDLEIPG